MRTLKGLYQQESSVRPVWSRDSAAGVCGQHASTSVVSKVIHVSSLAVSVAFWKIRDQEWRGRHFTVAMDTSESSLKRPRYTGTEIMGIGKPESVPFPL